MSNNNRQNRKQRQPRRTNRRQNLNHNQNNFDQQQNMVATRRTFKVKDSKVPRKYFYDSGYQQNMVQGGNIKTLASIQQGTQSDQRIGNKIVIRKIQIKYVASNSSTDVYNQVRFLLVYCPTHSLTLSDIMDSDQATSAIDPLSFPNAYATGTTFQVLHDQIHILNQNASNAAVHGELDIPVNLPSTWTYGQSVESGYLALVWMSDSAFSPHPYWTFNIRTHYTDL